MGAARVPRDRPRSAAHHLRQRRRVLRRSARSARHCSPMTWIGAAAIERLRTLDDEPDFSGTRYNIVERIGRGGMGTVFRGRDRALDREVAIKVTTLATASDAERLRAEARTLA